MNISMNCCGVLNPKTLLPDFPISGEPLHDCTSSGSIADKSHNNLLDIPLDNSDLILFTDGFPFMRGGVCYTGSAVVTELDTLPYPQI